MNIKLKIEKNDTFTVSLQQGRQAWILRKFERVCVNGMPLFQISARLLSQCLVALSCKVTANMNDIQAQERFFCVGVDAYHVQSSATTELLEGRS